MLKVFYTNRALKDIEIAKKRHYDMSLFKEVIIKLAKLEKLDVKYKDHALSGKWKGYRDCHIKPDWILIYKIWKDKLIIEVARTGSHSDLFKK